MNVRNLSGGAGTRRRISRRERGSALIEFTLVLLPTLAFLLMLMDLAWILFGWASVQEGVREGVRYGVTGQTLPATCLGDSIRSVVTRYSFGFITTANAGTQVTVTYLDPTTLQPVTGSNATAGGNVLQVTASGVSVGTFGAILRQFTPIHLSATSLDVMENSPIPPCP